MLSKVMYLGLLCETAPADVIFDNPRHPYTRLLLETIPDVEMTGRKTAPVAGEIPNPIDPPSGCAFHPRCPLANDRCRKEQPELKMVKKTSGWPVMRWRKTDWKLECCEDGEVGTFIFPLLKGGTRGILPTMMDIFIFLSINGRKVRKREDLRSYEAVML